MDKTQKCCSCGSPNPNPSCGLCRAYTNLIEHQMRATLADLDILLESLPKSLETRLGRRTLSTNPEKGERRPEQITPKHHGDNDPRQHRGKRNYRGSAKKNQDARQHRDMARKLGEDDQIDDAIALLASCAKKPLAECVTDIEQFGDKEHLRSLLSQALVDNDTRVLCEQSCGTAPGKRLNTDWLYRLLQITDLELRKQHG